LNIERDCDIIWQYPKEIVMENFSAYIMDIVPVLLAAGGLLWKFSKQITQIEAQLQALLHQVEDCKKAIEGNRQGRIEVFGVINNSLKVKDNEMSERLAKVETKIDDGITPSEVYSRLAKIEAEIDTLVK
jgi:uncharacterized protein YqgV (UPF0045/DUF77 family)